MIHGSDKSIMINEKIIKKFDIPGNLVDIRQKTNGIINKTYVATYNQDGKNERYLIQQINNNVFKNPYELMENIENVTSFLQKQMDIQNDTKHKVLKVIKTTDNKNLLVCKNEKNENEFYRAYNFIENSICYNTSENNEVVYNTGKAFGNFQKLLNNYPMDKLAETIKDFHNTKKRFETFEQTVEKNIANRVCKAKDEIEFILNRKDLSKIIVEKLEKKEIPLRVTHNDTKVNNVMMNKDTHDFLAVVDLDTVMPGSGLYDYGDGIRSAASNSLEDETDLSKVFIKKDLFEKYTDGFLSEVASCMNKEEVMLMGTSIRLTTFELALRFLDDYLNGDTYFACNYENHNLDRARNQIKLVEDIESKIEYMNNYILKSYEKYKDK